MFVKPITIADSYFVDITEKTPDHFKHELQNGLNHYYRNQGLEPINITRVFMKLKDNEDSSKKRTLFELYDLDFNKISKPSGKKLKAYSEEDLHSDGRYNEPGMIRKNKRTLSELYSDSIPTPQAKRFKVNSDGRYSKKKSPRSKSPKKEEIKEEEPCKEN